MTNEMTNNQPYLLRAVNEWIVDNGCTPYLYVNTQQHEALKVPEHLMDDNPLVLNISPNACKDLQLNNDAVNFQTRFGGQVFNVHVPMTAVMAIIARENGQGMTFEWANVTDTPGKHDNPTTRDDAPQKKESGLKVVR